MYLLGARKFQLATDHKPLLPLLNNPTAKVPPRIERLALKMQNLDFEMVHIPGKTNVTDLHVQTSTARNRDRPPREICHHHCPIRACCSPGQNQRRNCKRQRAYKAFCSHSNGQMDQDWPRPQAILRPESRAIHGRRTDPKNWQNHSPWITERQDYADSSQARTPGYQQD